MDHDKEMKKALEADGEKLRQLTDEDHGPWVLSGCTVRAVIQIEKAACLDKASFEKYIRDMRRPDIGDDADTMTEADFVSDLAEDGWPDHRKWLMIWDRIFGGGELTAREREQALAYWAAGDDEPAPEYRLA